MLMFKTGKFRVNGKRLTLDAALENAKIITSLKTTRTPVMHLQTMTAVYTVPYRLYLARLAALVQGSEQKNSMLL